MHKTKTNNYLILYLLLFFLSFQYGYAQEDHHDSEEEHQASEEGAHEAEAGNVTLALVVGFTTVPNAREEEGNSEAENLFTLGLDFFYHVADRWKIGAVFDLELAEYEVDFKGDRLPREKAIVTALIAGYEILPRWVVIAGPGIEFERNKNLFVIRIGTEYAIELGKNWELFPALNYDFKEEYNTFSVGIGVGKRF